ncbi:hypothetical protein VTK26DRAFT_1262 [Humicola hyalothermophila]
MPPFPSTLLPSLGHAASGATGTALSTLATYPLDLATTRLKVQRRLRVDGSIPAEDAYGGLPDALASIYCKEGGIRALFAGLGVELGKSAADSFLWFLFYTWFRALRLTDRREAAPYARAIEELAVGAAAGACAKAFTTPASNVVARRQTANLLSQSSGGGGSSSNKAQDQTFRKIVASIKRERGGVSGLWAGYSASLVLTLNPSITFSLQQMLKRAVVPRERWDDGGGAGVTFLLAAVSKVLATAATYPFQIAKARVQLSAVGGPGEEEEEGNGDNDDQQKRGGKIKGFAKETIFATVLKIAKDEGAAALYDGMSGELLKGFFSHGTTMLSKDVIHRFIVQLYFAILAALRRYPQFNASSISERLRQGHEKVRQRFLEASSALVNQTRQEARHATKHLTFGKALVGSK